MSKRTQRRPRYRGPTKPSNELGEPAGKPKNASLEAPFYLAVDRQLKSGYDTYEKAENAALAIKRKHPRLLVTVYEATFRRHIVIEQPEVVVAFNGRRDPMSGRNGMARYAASATKH